MDWGISPRDFWEMTPAELMIIYDRKRPFDPARDYAGSLTESAIEDLLGEFNG